MRSVYQQFLQSVSRTSTATRLKNNVLSCKRNGISIKAPIDINNVAGYSTSVVDIFNDALNGKRDSISIKAPIDVSPVANYNIVDILNDVLKCNEVVSVNAPVDVWNIADGKKVQIIKNV